MNPEDVTIVIPCYNTVNTLPSVLCAVHDFPKAPSEILCVDGGSTDGTHQVIQNDSTAVLIEQRGSNRGIPAALNIALERIKTSGLAKLDADLIPEPNWLRVVCDTLTRQNAAAVAGCTIEQVTSVADEWRVAHVNKNPYVVNRNHETPKIPDDDDLRGNLREWNEPKRNIRLQGWQTLFDVGALREIGGWNERFQRGYQDMDISNRLLQAGYETYYTPDTKAIHIRTDTKRSILAAAWNYVYHGRYEPTRYRELPRRFGNHVLQAWHDAIEDLRTGQFHLIPISLSRPAVNFQIDLQHVRANRRRERSN